MSYECRDCKRDCDVMIDGCHEMMVGGDVCDKCMYGEWTQRELEEREDLFRIDECGCRAGCEWCLCVETRSVR